VLPSYLCDCSRRLLQDRCRLAQAVNATERMIVVGRDENRRSACFVRGYQDAPKITDHIFYICQELLSKTGKKVNGYG
jgi:hypothetical protein